MRSAIAAAVVLGVTAFQPDAQSVLADMRQAIGGEAAIAAVQGFSVNGTESTNFDGRTADARVEWMCALPDKYVRVRRVATPFSQSVHTQGFNGDARITRHDSDFPQPPDPFENDTPAERAAREQRSVAMLKREFSRLAIALGVAAIDPVDASYVGRRDVDGAPADIVTLRSSDGYVARVYVDAATHRPVMVGWMAAPIVTFSTTTTSVVRVPAGRTPGSVPIPPPTIALPPGDPTAELPDVEHQLRFEDFKTADGLTWPHRFVHRVGGRVWTTTKMGKYKLNPKIDPKHFDPSRK
jgi:hypothetical protein